MNTFFGRLLIVTAGIALLMVACGEEGTAEEPAGDRPLEGELNLVGSTTVQPIAEVLAESFEALHPEVTIYVQGGGSSVGVRAAADRSADIGMASREVKVSELQENPEIVIHTIARDGIAVAAEPGCTVDDLTLEQVKQIFAGEITNWNQLGGGDMAITVVAREEGSGTRAAFEELVMGDALITETAILQPSNGAVRTTISVTPGSIGFLSFGYLDDQTKSIAIDGALPTEENAASGDYTVVRPLNMITWGEADGAAGAFLDFVKSRDGQSIVTAEGYLPIN
ncbi:MAG: phosphate ABC transporter substrate-binding protein [Candidatus Aegiribacteria sp.]